MLYCKVTGLLLTPPGVTVRPGPARTPPRGLGHVLQGPGEASSAVGAREAAIRHLQVPALLFCPGRDDGVDHDQSARGPGDLL